MNIKIIILTVSSFIFSLATLMGQNVIITSGIYYNLEDERYNKHQISDYLETQPESKLYIQKYRKQKSDGTWISLAGLGVLGAAVTTAIITKPEGNNQLNPKYALLTGGGATVGLLMIPFGLLMQMGSSSHFEKAIDIYNESQNENIGSAIKPSLNLVLGNNGIGLLLRF